MATVSASAPSSFIACATLLPNRAAKPSAPPALGNLHLNLNLDGLRATRGKGRVCCNLDERASACNTSKKVSMGASVMAAGCLAAMSSPAMALVDERLSTEGTGLSLGLSNNLLGWILLGIFCLIWALYFVYTSTLEEDQESGLSL